MSHKQIAALLLIFVNLALCGSSMLDMFRDPDGRKSWVGVVIGVMNGLSALALVACWGAFK